MYLFWNKPFSGFLELYNFFLFNLESSNFLRRCEYIERKTPSKNILEFHKHFSSRSHHKLFFGSPCINQRQKFHPIPYLKLKYIPYSLTIDLNQS